MNIVISDIRDALVNSGIKNPMKAIGEHLSIKLNNGTLCIIHVYSELTYNGPLDTTRIIYKIKVPETGNTLEENTIKVPNFIIPGYNAYYNRDAGGMYKDCYVVGVFQNEATFKIYESQDLLKYIPQVIDELVEAIKFYNGDE